MEAVIACISINDRATFLAALLYWSPL